jgi:hypothetical protein
LIRHFSWVQFRTHASLAVPVSQAAFGSAQRKNLNRNFPARARFSDVTIEGLISNAVFKMDTKTYSDGSSAKRFRDYAAECRRMAAQSSSEKDRMVLMDIAQAWTVCAGEVERKTKRASFGMNE